MQSRVFSSSTLVGGVAALAHQQVKMEDERVEMEKELQDLIFGVVVYPLKRFCGYPLNRFP